MSKNESYKGLVQGRYLCLYDSPPIDHTVIRTNMSRYRLYFSSTFAFRTTDVCENKNGCKNHN